MTLDDYINHRVSAENCSIGELYGTESFCHFLYSLVKMDRPSVVVELGCGGAATTLMASQALKGNGHGHIWTVDNGADWKIETIRRACQTALGPIDDDEPYSAFIGRLFQTMGVSELATLVEMNLDGSNWFAPDAPIDMLFSDSISCSVEDCVSIFKYYLPRVSPFSSIFIDRGGTINHVLLFLKYVVQQFNIGKIPWNLLDGVDEKERAAMERLVNTCEFQLINLTDTKHGKKNWVQNSRAWIKIQPVDYRPHNDVVSFGSIPRPWER